MLRLSKLLYNDALTKSANQIFLNQQKWNAVRTLSLCTKLEKMGGGLKFNQKDSKTFRERVKMEQKRLEKRKQKQKEPVIDTERYVSIKQVSDLTGRPLDSVKLAVSEAIRMDVSKLGPKFMLVEQTSISNIFKKLGFRRRIIVKTDEEASMREVLSKKLQDITPSCGVDAKRLAASKRRPPIICMLGHVDHGKTTLLDYIRKSTVAEQEDGGITQKISAFSCKVTSAQQRVTFVDVPGHAAFTSMRMRGAKLTDIVVLVVSSDDGVMEQTIESIRMMKRAGASVVVAINKCDLKRSNPERTLLQLAEHGIVCEPLGGDVQCENISAKTGAGVDSLLEKILMENELLGDSTRADAAANVEGVVVESHMDPHHGNVATCIIKHGTLKRGQFLVCNTSWARTRALLDENWKKVDKAGPSKPVSVIGWKGEGVVAAGQGIVQVKNEATAKKMVELRQRLHDLERIEEEKLTVGETREEEKRIYEAVKEMGLMSKKRRASQLTDDLKSRFEQLQHDLQYNIIVKADTIGSLEVIESLLGSYSAHHQVALNVVASGVGEVKASDVERAQVSDAALYLFNLPPPSEACARQMDQLQVRRLHHFTVIYHLYHHLKQHLHAMLPPKSEFFSEGEAKVKKIFVVDGGKQVVCGSLVEEGSISRDDHCQLMRDGEVVYEGTVSSVRCGKTEVAVVKEGDECGIVVTSDSDGMLPQEGDVIVCGETHQVENELEWQPEGF